MTTFITIGVIVCVVAFLFAYDRLSNGHRYRVIKRMVQGRHFTSPMFMAQRRFSFFWYPIGPWHSMPADAWRVVNAHIERQNETDENFYDPSEHVDPSFDRRSSEGSK